MFVEVVNHHRRKNALSLTYRVPYELEQEVKEGIIVSVPIRNKIERGIITGIHFNRPLFKTRDLISVDIADHQLKDWQFEAAKHIAQYYHCSLGKSLTLFLPPELFKTFKRKSARTPIEKYRFSQEKNPEKIFQKKKLNPQQQQALDAIISSEKKSFLLKGITGSGKTEIYLQLAQHLAQENKQTLILVPEIGLTPQLIEYFYSVFEKKIAIIHSKLAAGEKKLEWERIESGAAEIIIGSRSALFAPFKNLGAIIIDEEHEWTYKQENEPRYHARAVALKIGELINAKVILASATPSIETYYEAQNGVHQLLELKNRINDVSLPKCEIVDMRNELKKQNYSIFSEALFEKIKMSLEAEKQSILFLNRRGFHSSMVCRDCGQAAKCRNCDIALVIHKKPSGSWLVCHYCGFNQGILLTCPLCKSPRIKALGIGTQRVETELKKLFPLARILRADKDSTSGKYDFEKIYQSFSSGQADILIGTQMIAKGLDIENVDLVGIILADIGLHIPHFRSFERTFQLITQVAGRAGRKSGKGEVIIQTYMPENVAIRAAAMHDYAGFYETEIASRNSLKYPPFSRIIKLIFQDKNEKKLIEKTQEMEEKLNKVFLNKLHKNLSKTMNKKIHTLSNKNFDKKTNKIITNDKIKNYENIPNINFTGNLNKNNDQNPETIICSAPLSPYKVANQYRYAITIKSPNPDIILSELTGMEKCKIDIDSA